MDTEELMRKRIAEILLAAMTMAAAVTGCGSAGNGMPYIITETEYVATEDAEAEEASASELAAGEKQSEEEDDDETKAFINVSYHNAEKLEDNDFITVIRDGNVIAGMGKIDANLNEDEYIIYLSEGTYEIISDNLGEIELTIDNLGENYGYYELYIDYETEEFTIYETEEFAVEE